MRTHIAIRSVMDWVYSRKSNHVCLINIIVIFGLLVAGCKGTAPTPAADTPPPTLLPTFTPIPAPTLVPASEKLILFVSDRDGQQDIYALRGDGSRLVRLTNDAAQEVLPQWSPDGQKIAYLSEKDGEDTIFLMDIREGDITRVTTGYHVRQFEWSPGGREIVFAARKPKSGIYVVPLDGGEPAKLVAGSDYYYVPTWSPDGNSIAYLAGDENSRKIYIMNSDGSGQQALTPVSYEKLYAVAWSPDGKQLAFSATDKQSDIYLINLGDGRLVQLTNDSTEDEVIAGAYSSDGQWLLFWSSPKEFGDIYRLNIQTGEREQLTTDSHDDFYPHWSPDGQQIVFNSYRDENADIYFLDLQSKSEQNLTDHPAKDSDPDWYPLEPAIETGVLAKQAAEEMIPTPTLSPLPERGLIVYLSDASGSNEIYAISPDGKDAVRLTDNNLYELGMDWSPDCSQGVISAFPEESVFDEDSNLFLIQRDGSNVKQVTYRSFTALVPQWSPDGSKIMFLSDDPGVTDLYELDLETYQVGKLTQKPLGGDMHTVPWQYRLADWSPDGKWIVYAGPGDVNWDIFKVSADGKEVTLLNADSPADISPAWSPDGTRVAFVRYLPEGCTENCAPKVFLMNSNGSEIKPLVDTPSVSFNPVWSPDGQKILFSSDQDGNTEIYVVNIDGSGLKNLTGNKANDYSPLWSPDGTQIVFTSEQNGNPEIYVMDNDGRNIVQLTDHPGNDYPSAWLCPGGR